MTECPTCGRKVHKDDVLICEGCTAEGCESCMPSSICVLCDEDDDLVGHELDFIDDEDD